MACAGIDVPLGVFATMWTTWALLGRKRPETGPTGRGSMPPTNWQLLAACTHRRGRLFGETLMTTFRRAENQR